MRDRVEIVLLLITFSAVSLGAEERSVSFVAGVAHALPSAACEVHRFTAGSSKEKVDACGRRVILEADDEKIWLEQGEWISPWPVRASDAVTKGASEIALPLTRGGRVALAPHVKADKGKEVILVYYPHAQFSPYFRPSLARPLRPGESVLLPSGLANAAIAVSIEEGAISAVSQPITPATKGVTEVDVRPSTEGGDVVLSFDWPDPVPGDSLRKLDLRLRSGDSVIEPGVVLRSDVDGIAVWYGIEAGDATIELESDGWYLKPLRTKVRDGRVAAENASLRRLPSINVTVSMREGELPKEALDRLVVKVTKPGETEPLEQIRVVLDEPSLIEALPPSPLVVTVEVGGAEAHQAVDLTSGTDADVRIELEPIVVHGVVRHGKKPVPAAVAFNGATFETDDGGRYRATLWQAGRYVVTTIAPRVNDDRPLRDTLRVSGDLELDITIPDIEAVVRVFDRETGKPIEGATVGGMNRWKNDEAKEELGSRGSSVSIAAKSGGDGVAILPPLREGSLSLRVAAEGYQRWDRDMEFVSTGRREVIDVGLTPTEAAGSVRLLLPDGRPAVDAVVTVLHDNDAVWSGRSDREGRVAMAPEAEGASIVVRHPEAGVAVRRWERRIDGDPEWRLPPAAPPLVVNVRHRDGTTAGQVLVVVWIDGLPFGAANPHAGLRPMSTLGGVWTAHNLPAAPLRIVALTRRSSLSPASPSLDAVATTIPYPWPPNAVIEPID